MVKDCGSFIAYDAADWREVAQERPPFRVAGVLSATVTLVYGQSEAGKSMFAQGLIAALVGGKGQFLGREAAGTGWTAGVLTSDYGDGCRYSERIGKANPDALRRGALRIYDTSAQLPFDGWERLLEEVRDAGHKLLVIDNLSALVPGDINQGPPCKYFFDALGPFTADGTAVVVVAHSSEKRDQHGNAQDFIGHSTIRQRPAWHCRVRKDGDRKRLRFHGNDGGTHEMIVRQPEPGTPVFEVISEAGSAELAEREGKRRRERADQTRADADKIRDYVLGNCQGMNGKQAASALVSAGFKGAESTHATKLSRGAYGIRAIDGGGWERPLKAA